jgi:hypothetical protein
MEDQTCSTPDCDRPLAKRTGECSSCRSRRWREENPGGRHAKTETNVCQCCGAKTTREVQPGPRPKWCAECRRKGLCRQAACQWCKAKFWARYNQTFCSVACARRERLSETLQGDMRTAYEKKDWSRLLDTIRARTQQANGCWVWQGPMTRQGYGYTVLGGKKLQAHRLAVMGALGAELGSQSVHHKCANRACVNPDHLQPVTHQENVAEMLSRQSYLARIRELEGALAEADPTHPLLALVAVA